MMRKRLAHGLFVAVLFLACGTLSLASEESGSPSSKDSNETLNTKTTANEQISDGEILDLDSDESNPLPVDQSLEAKEAAPEGSLADYFERLEARNPQAGLESSRGYQGSSFESMAAKQEVINEALQQRTDAATKQTLDKKSVVGSDTHAMEEPSTQAENVNADPTTDNNATNSSMPVNTTQETNQDPEPEGAEQQETKEAPEGSLASFFEKLEAKAPKQRASSKPGGTSSTNFEAMAARQEEVNSVLEEMIQTNDRQPKKETSSPAPDQIQTPKTSKTNMPEYNGTPWGVGRPQTRPPDMELLYQVFKDRVQRDVGIPPSSSYQEALFPLSMGQPSNQHQERQPANEMDADTLPKWNTMEGTDFDIMEALKTGDGRKLVLQRISNQVKLLRQGAMAAKTATLQQWKLLTEKEMSIQQRLQRCGEILWNGGEWILGRVNTLIDQWTEEDESDFDHDHQMDIDRIRESLEETMRQTSSNGV